MSILKDETFTLVNALHEGEKTLLLVLLLDCGRDQFDVHLSQLLEEKCKEMDKQRAVLSAFDARVHADCKCTCGVLSAFDAALHADCKCTCAPRAPFQLDRTDGDGTGFDQSRMTNGGAE